MPPRRLGPSVVAAAALVCVLVGTSRARAEDRAAVAAPGAGAPPPPQPDAAAPAPPPPPERRPSHSEAKRTIRTLAWVSLAIGGEAAVAAIATSFMVLHQKSVRDDNCNAQKVCNATGLAANDTLGTIVPWNTASWIVAAASVGIGAGLWFASREDSAPRTAVTVSPTRAGLVLGVWRTF
jgi:hypothetical protein